MIRIAICDSQIESLERVHQLVVNHLKLTAKDEFLVRRFQSVYDLLECLESPHLYFDIYLLEVETPICGGIEVGQLIRKNDEYAGILYMAQSADFALAASDTSPLRYLIKPLHETELTEALDSAYRKVAPMQSKNLLIKRRDGLSNIALHQIEYIEYRDHALTFHLRDGQAVEGRTMNESFSQIMEKSLTDARFIKPHASFAVNMDLVRSMNAKEFEMDSGVVIPISKRMVKEVRERFLAYSIEENGAIVI